VGNQDDKDLKDCVNEEVDAEENSEKHTEKDGNNDGQDNLGIVRYVGGWIRR